MSDSWDQKNWAIDRLRSELDGAIFDRDRYKAALQAIAFSKNNGKPLPHDWAVVVAHAALTPSKDGGE